MCFISLPHFIEFIRTSSTMLNRNNETKHSWFVSDNMKKAFGVSSLDMIHPFISLINFFYILCFLLMCIKNGRLILSNTFFSTPIDHMDFFFCINHLKQTQQQTKLKSHTVVHPIPEDQYKWFPVGKTWYRIQSRKISNMTDNAQGRQNFWADCNITENNLVWSNHLFKTSHFLSRHTNIVHNKSSTEQTKHYSLAAISSSEQENSHSSHDEIIRLRP